MIQTIAEVLEGTDIGVLSDHEFDVSYLEKYPHSPQLLECCWQAVRELADEPYCGRVSSAKVMGHAMELHRRIHGVNAPRGWVPVMRTLRAAGSNPSNQPKADTLPADCLLARRNRGEITMAEYSAIIRLSNDVPMKPEEFCDLVPEATEARRIELADIGNANLLRVLSRNPE